MAEELIITDKENKEEQYQELLPQIKALITGETDLYANLANISAALKQAMHFFWVGFYLVKEDSLVLGPFQGPIACTRIGFGKGVCGTCWEKKETQLVEDVERFPGHIACSTDSRSEIVIPLVKEGRVMMILDVDSEYVANFDAIDKKYLEELMAFLGTLL